MNLQKMQEGSKTLGFFEILSRMGYTLQSGEGEFSMLKMMHMCTSFGPTIVDAILPQWHNIMVL